MFINPYQYGSQCWKCGQYTSSTFHNCYYWTQQPSVGTVSITKSCGACGSTAIDHTDAQCKANQGKKNGI